MREVTSKKFILEHSDVLPSSMDKSVEEISHEDFDPVLWQDLLSKKENFNYACYMHQGKIKVLYSAYMSLPLFQQMSENKVAHEFPSVIRTKHPEFFSQVVCCYDDILVCLLSQDNLLDPVGIPHETFSNYSYYNSNSNMFISMLNFFLKRWAIRLIDSHSPEFAHVCVLYIY